MTVFRGWRGRGVLVIEAVVASFLMLFAFVASAALFDAAIRWESDISNLRRAALVADKKMEELRVLTSEVPSGSSFDEVLAPLAGPHPEYPEALGFAIEVVILDNIHRPVPSSGLHPTPGVHSPCSSMFTKVPTPTENLPDGNPQLNNAFSTYPYTRHLRDSYRLVQVAVTYADGAKTYPLVSLLGDPVTPFGKTPKVEVTFESGSTTLGNASTTAVYSAQVVTETGSKPKDVTIFWGVTLDSSGSLILLPLDSSARRVQIRRGSSTVSGIGAQARLQAVVRYGGQEAVGVSDPISLP